jgi:glycosyltransferase domain-containing protein
MNRENLDDLTIICPTYNRPHMLNRVLKYYVDNNFSCKIIIADSSETGARNIVLDLVDKCSSRLNVEYFHMPESTDFGLKLYTASKKISTKYVVVMPDDDLVIKSGLLRAMSELDSDPLVSAAYGNRLSIASTRKPDSGIEWIKILPHYNITINQSDPIDRIRRLPVPSWWMFPYSVYRTDVLSKSLNVIHDMNYCQFTEFFFYSAVLAYGKWIKVDCLFAICNEDSEYYTLRDRESFPFYWGVSGSIFAQISRPFWSSHILELSTKVGDILSNKDNGKNKDKLIRGIYFSINNRYLEDNGMYEVLFDDTQRFAKKINRIRVMVNKLFWVFLLPDRASGINYWIRLAKVFLYEFITGRLIRLIKCDFTINGLKNILINIKRTGTLDYEFHELIKKSSKYYDDFYPAYEAWRENPCPTKYNKS